MPRKSSQWTDEQKRARGEQVRQRWQDPEYRAMMHKASVGHHNLGAESRRKMSEARIGKPLSEEHKASMSVAAKRLWQDEAYRRKITARVNDPAVRASMNRPETVARRNESHRQHWAGMPAEVRQQRIRKWSQAGADAARIKLRGRIPTKKQRNAASAVLKRLWKIPGWRQKITEQARARFANLTPEEQQARVTALRAHLTTRDKPTSIETAVAQALDAMGISYQAQKPFGPYIADFCLSQYHLIVEADGDYWHNRPGEKERDAKRDGWFAQRGWQTIRITQTEIEKDALTAVRVALNPFIQEA